MKKQQSQELTREQAADMICKSMYKALAKFQKSKRTKKIAQEIVNDVLDPNYVAEVDPDSIPANEKENVMHKGKQSKLKKKKKKGTKKLKDFMDKRCK